MVKEKKKLIFEEYFDIHDDCVKRYGEKTVIYMMVGDFYELYSYKDRGPNLGLITDLMDIVLTKKSGDKELSPNNPNMSGFQRLSLNKYVNKMIRHNYTVVIINQVKTGSEITREIEQVVSPSTNIDEINIENKYLMTLYIEINNSFSSNKNVYSCGLTAIECLSNKVITYELNTNDYYNFMNEITRFYMSYIPEELIIYEINNTDKREVVYSNINFVKGQYYRVYNKINYNYTKVKYQNKLFEKVYKDENKIISKIEELNLSKSEYSRVSLIIAFEFLNERNSNILVKLQKPEFYNDNKFMKLYNNAQHQLNIIDNDVNNYNTSYNSLNDVVNQCITPMGKKYLKERLCSPYIDKKIINNYYNFTDIILKDKQYENVREMLKGIYDLQKLFRKLVIKYLKPMEFMKVYISLKNSYEMIKKLENSDINNFIYEFLEKESICKLEKIIKNIENRIDIDIFKNCDLLKLERSIFKYNCYEDIDKLQKELDLGNCNLDTLEENFKKYDSKVCIKYTKKSKTDKGYFIKFPLKNGLKFKEQIERDGYVNIDNNNKIMYEDLEFKELKNEVRIKFLSLNDESKNIDEVKEEISKLCLDYYKSETKSMYENNELLFNKLIKLLINIDYISNNAYVSDKFHYSRPIINENKNSFINSEKIRHPIIERLIDYEYVPNDIVLDENNTGIMLYSLNSAGKSSLMKTVGLCLIMAQCGLYVPAVNFEYSIFNSLFTRITAQDNLFKGQSSFIVELVEMDAIFNFADKNSLVIGDEVCRGTEVNSANALVASSITHLLKKQVKFLFATHLHDIPKLEKIKGFDNLKFYHLSVDIDEMNNIKFNRKLNEGIGHDNYGLLVASNILHNKKIIDTAYEYKKELLNNLSINSKLLNDKKSLYNNKVYVDKCNLCGSNEKLEVHHILYQKDFNNGYYKNKEKFHILKDDESNLMVLCLKCHDKMHSNDKKNKIIN